MLKQAIPLFIVAMTVASTHQASAKCGDQYAGPIDQNPAYVFSSSCKTTKGDEVELQNEVCSITAGSLPFYWEKLNWVSGSQGVQSGECLSTATPTNISNVIDAPDSTLHLYAGIQKSNTTNVFISGSTGSQDEIDKSISLTALKDKGTVTSFQFRISFSKRGSNSVSIRATMQGTDPVFYIYLPRSIRNEKDLEAFISPYYLDDIRPLIAFDDEGDKVRGQDKDPVISTYRRINELSRRARIGTLGDSPEVGIAFDVSGTPSNVASAITVCVGYHKSAVACL